MTFFKNTKTALTFSIFTTLIIQTGLAQTSEFFRQQENASLQETSKAFNVFLNENLSEDQRIEAVSKHALVKSPKQLDALKSIVRNTSNSDRIRTTALRKIKHYVKDDIQLYDEVVAWLLNTGTPTMLRKETLETIGSLSFTSFGMQAVPDHLLDIYRKLMDDPIIEYRKTALNFLVLHGDDNAQQRLIRGLQNPAASLLPASESIALLGHDIHGDHYPVIYKVLQETTDKSTKIQAIKVLGNYELAKGDIIDYLNDAKEDRDIRLAAIKTLNAFDQGNFSDYTQPLFEKENTPDELLIYAINAEKYRRILPANRDKESDSFDISVKSLINKDRSDDLIKAAKIYVNTLSVE